MSPRFKQEPQGTVGHHNTPHVENSSPDHPLDHTSSAHFRPASNATRLLALQRLVGNQVVQRIVVRPLQRQDHNEAAPPSASEGLMDPWAIITPEELVVQAAQIAANPEPLRARARALRPELGIPYDSEHERGGWFVTQGGDRRIDLARGGTLLIENLARQLTERTPERQSSTAQSMLAQLRAVRAVDPQIDASLALAIAYRESGQSILSVSRNLTNTYSGGGLDFLGRLLRRHHLTLPPGHGSRWSSVGVGGGADHDGTNERDAVTEEALIPRNEQIIAYGLVVKLSRERFEQRAREIFAGHPALTSLTRMSTRARRMWTQLCFGVPNGSHFRPHRRSLGVLGTRTVLELLRFEMNAGRAQDFEDIMTLPQIQDSHHIMRARVTAGDAELLDEFLHIAP